MVYFFNNHLDKYLVELHGFLNIHQREDICHFPLTRKSKRSFFHFQFFLKWEPLDSGDGNYILINYVAHHVKNILEYEPDDDENILLTKNFVGVMKINNKVIEAPIYPWTVNTEKKRVPTKMLPDLYSCQPITANCDC